MINNLKIGQQVLVKAYVVDNDINNFKVNIDKYDSTNQTINIDKNSIFSCYYKTTQELLDELKNLEIEENIKDVELRGHGNEVLEVEHTDDLIWFGYKDYSDDCGEYSVYSPLEEMIVCVSKTKLGVFNFSHDYITNVLEDDAADTLIKLILAYAYTPIELRGFVEVIKDERLIYDDFFDQGVIFDDK